MLIDGVGLVWECSMGLGMLFSLYLDIVKSSLKKFQTSKFALKTRFQLVRLNLACKNAFSSHKTRIF